MHKLELIERHYIKNMAANKSLLRALSFLLPSGVKYDGRLTLKEFIIQLLLDTHEDNEAEIILSLRDSHGDDHRLNLTIDEFAIVLDDLKLIHENAVKLKKARPEERARKEG